MKGHKTGESPWSDFADCVVVVAEVPCAFGAVGALDLYTFASGIVGVFANNKLRNADPGPLTEWSRV